MFGISRAWLLDVAERAGWSGVQGAVAYLIVALSSLPDWVAAPIIVGLVLVKGLAARKVGDSDSAATLPAARPDLGPALDRSGP